ncbi:MAG: type II toxin-antitoxin system PemK/MazF family toxin [Acidobacteria bacterium]|nr:type II toxin-antitoxin system PemK/MazF family toxin [Acidobacteriota bacterium]
MAKSLRQKEAKVGFPRRGEIYLVDFDPARGHEIKKTRPALVIQNDVGNQYSSITIVAAITSRISDRPYPVEVVLEAEHTGLKVRSTVRLDQIRTVDKERLIKRLGSVSRATMPQVNRAIQISLGLVEL